jgi:hypothetical protein
VYLGKFGLETEQAVLTGRFYALSDQRTNSATQRRRRDGRGHAGWLTRETPRPGSAAVNRSRAGLSTATAAFCRWRAPTHVLDDLVGRDAMQVEETIA